MQVSKYASLMMSMQACNEYASVMSEHGKLAWKASTGDGDVLMKNISPLYKFSLKGGGWDEQRQPKTQPSAEIVRVECAKCRRERDWCGARATLCGDRACRVREMQARVQFAGCARNPMRRSCVSSARNAGESAIGSERAQPSAEIVRVECAKCRRECDLPAARATLCGDRACRVREMQARVRLSLCARNPLRRSGVSGAKSRREVYFVVYITLVRGVSGELEAENWRLSSTTLVRGVAGELEAENWRLSSTTVVRGVAGEWEDENWRLGSTT